VVIVATVLAATVLPASVSAQSETPADKAAREIQEARDEANAAADAYFAAESVLAQLEDELLGLQEQEVVLQGRVDDLRREVEQIALERYIQSGTVGIPLLTDVSAPQDQIQAEVFVDVLTNTSANILDEFDAAETELEDTQVDVADRQAEIENQKDVFTELEAAALGEVERLREIEQERLQDEAVQRALAAQIAAERAALEEQARIESEAAARAQPNPGLVVPPSTTTTLPPTTTVPIDTTPGADAEPTDEDPAGATTTEPPPETTPPTLAPETTLPENSGGSGGTSGGRTGGGGGGNNPVGITTGAGYIDNIICPMPGGAYGDTWGAPRSGGRRHEGVDIIAPTGIPIYAVTSGQVSFRSNRLGGNTVSLLGDSGNRYYYAHLSRYEGGNRYVVQGEIIGYNGDSGNAKFSTPHLHFQIMPGNGRPVNPYPSVRAAGC